MQVLTKQGNTVTWRDTTLNFVEVEKISNEMVHCHFTDITVCFIGGDTEVNGVVCQTADEIIHELNK